MSLLRRKVIHDTLHCCHLLLHLLDEIIQRIDTGEILTVLLHECVEIRFFPFLSLAQHFVQVTNHFAHFGYIFRSHILQRLLHPLEELLHHLLLQTIHQFFELLTRLVVHEVVLRKSLNLARNIPWQLIKVILLALGNHLQHFSLLLGCEIVILPSAGLALLAFLSVLVLTSIGLLLAL